MAKIKLTKGELKRQKDDLKRFNHYLPTLLLKKQQLQMQILESKKFLKERMKVMGEIMDKIDKWVNLMADPGIDITEWITPQSIDVEQINIAGANVPEYKDIHFKSRDYDFYEMPLWVDKGIEEIRLFITLMAEVELIKQRIAILEKELRTTSQRVNLFEKVKIPECKDNIRIISIYLGDQQANAVGVSKVAKKKIEQKAMETAAA